MIKAAEIVMEKGVCTLPYVFREVFPGMTYTMQNAKHHLLSSPLAAIRIFEALSGKTEVNLIEAMKGVDFARLCQILTCATKHASPYPA